MSNERLCFGKFIILTASLLFIVVLVIDLIWHPNSNQEVADEACQSLGYHNATDYLKPRMHVIIMIECDGKDIYESYLGCLEYDKWGYCDKEGRAWRKPLNLSRSWTMPLEGFE